MVRSDLDGKRRFSRGTLIRKAGVLGVAAAVPGGLLSQQAEAASVGSASYETYSTLGPGQADVLEALIERLLPTDAVGPGAVELGVGQFIDRALGGALQSNRIDYDRGLSAIDAYSESTYGVAFKDASPDKQDAMITLMQANRLAGFNVDSRTFFNLVREHVLQGTFGDPYWGGNKNGGGWKLMAIPGISLDVKAADQELGRTTYVSQYKNSTYDWDEFKRSK